MAVSFFDTFTPQEVARISAAGTAVRVPQGWSPIWEKTPADKAYILLEGTVSVRRADIRAATLERGHVQSVFINGHRHDPHAGGLECTMGAEITWLFHRDAVARLEQRGGGEPERGLGSGHNEYLIRLAPHRSRRTKMLGHCAPEASEAGWVAVCQTIGTLRTDLASDQLRPRRVRKEVECREAELKRHHRQAPTGRERLIERSPLADRSGALPSRR